MLLRFAEVPTRLKIGRMMSSVLRDAKPRLTVSKIRSLADEPIHISAFGLKAHQKVTLHAITTMENGASFESFSHYVANDEGYIALNKEESHGGTFKGIEPMGPLWSMVPSPFNKRKYERFLMKDPSQPFDVKLSLHDSFVERLEKMPSFPNPLAEISIFRLYTAPGVREYEVCEGRIRATLYLPAGKGPFPGVISISGGYPGAMKHKASLLASRGFAALALRYFGTDDLPSDMFTSADLTYFEEAAMFLKNHPSVAGESGVGFIANCFGAHIALALASCAPPGLLGCVVAVSTWIFTLDGFRYNDKVWKMASGVGINVTEGPEGSTLWEFYYDHFDSGIDKLREACFEVQKRHDISYMFVYGDEDGYIPTEGVANMVKRLFTSTKHRRFSLCYYPGAGHLIEHAFCPLASFAWTLGETHYTGGSQPGHEKAQQDSWPKILDFTRKSLQGNVCQGSKL